MSTVQAVKDRLQELCRQKGWTYHALAIQSGVHPSTVKGIVYGKSQNPGIITLKKLCDGLDITLCDFFGTKTFRELEQEIK